MKILSDYIIRGKNGFVNLLKYPFSDYKFYEGKRYIKSYDHYVRWSYDTLRVQQPHIEVKGLWKKGNQYYIVCPNLKENTLTIDGKQTLHKWFSEHKAATSPVILINEITEGDAEVKDRSLKEIIEHSGDPRTLHDISKDLALLLPKPFPKFTILAFPRERSVTVPVERPLTRKEDKAISEAIESLQLPIDFYQVRFDPNFPTDNRSFRNSKKQGDLTLLPSSYLSISISKKLRNLWEQDEQFWVDNRVKILGTLQNKKDDYLIKGWKKNFSRCLINTSAFTAEDIRNYLSKESGSNLDC